MRQIVAKSRQDSTLFPIWKRLLECSELEIYTDGSAPRQNPGGVTGFAAIAVPRGEEEAVLCIGGHIPARSTVPKSSNNRAEIAGVLAALEIVRVLKNEGGKLNKVVVWCDSQYVVKCATGVYKRHKNSDLWQVYEGWLRELKRIKGISDLKLLWTRAHVGTRFNELADRLAKRSALEGGNCRIGEFQVGERAGGVELSDGVSDYTIWLDFEGKGGEGTAKYKVATRTGNSALGDLCVSVPLRDEAEYLALEVALKDLLKRITSAGSRPGCFSVTVKSYRDLLVRQLRREYKVNSPRLQAVYQRVTALLERFGVTQVHLVPKVEVRDCMLS